MTIENKENLKSGLPKSEDETILENNLDIHGAERLLAKLDSDYLKKVVEVKYGKDTIERIKNKLAAGEDLDSEDMKIFQKIATGYRPDLGLDPNRKNEKLFESQGIEIREGLPQLVQIIF